MRKQESIKLKTGYELHVKALQIRETYNGEILVGEPMIGDNIRVYANLSCPADWSVTKCIFDKSDFDLDKKVFSPYTVWVWFEADKSVNDPEGKFDYSELAIAFTIDSISDFSIQKLIKSGFDDFPWEQFAVNLKY